MDFLYKGVNILLGRNSLSYDSSLWNLKQKETKLMQTL